jgi:hypothetical protein
MIALDCLRVKRSVLEGAAIDGWVETQIRSPTNNAVRVVALFNVSSSDSGVLKRAANRVHESFGFAM